MLDNDLIRLFLPLLNTGFTDLGYSNITVQQSFQPTSQGIIDTPLVSFYKLYDKRYGFKSDLSKLDIINNLMIRSEVQYYETTFQVSALVKQDPNNIGYTASDLVNTAAYIMQSTDTIEFLQENDVGLLRLTDVRNPYFLNDRDQNTASPSFDFTLTHKQIFTKEVDIITRQTINIYRV
jgi:hypothetical protein